MRIGQAVDIHQLCNGRDLILGGVKIEHEKGLLGHSDADVLTHAIMESVLGALALGDLGKHFPDTDPKYKGVSSMILLEHVYHLMDENTFMTLFKKRAIRLVILIQLYWLKSLRWHLIFKKCEKISHRFCIVM